MAIFHHNATPVKRSAGSNAVGYAAYRAGEKLEDKKNKKVYNYSKKKGVDYSVILTPIEVQPQNSWMTDREELWNIVEETEKRSDSQVAREIVIAIPNELDRDTKIELALEYVQSSYVDRGMIADVNLHGLDTHNPHIHIMLTMRELIVSPIDNSVEFGLKNRDWNKKELLLKHRKEWEVIANKYLEQAGFSENKIDCRSLIDQGIVDRIPQIHLGVHVNAMRKRGIPTDRGDEYDRIEKYNQNIKDQLEDIYNQETELTELSNQIEIAEKEKPVKQRVKCYPTMEELKSFYNFELNHHENNRKNVERIKELISSMKKLYGQEEVPGEYGNPNFWITWEEANQLDIPIEKKNIVANNSKSERPINEKEKEELELEEREYRYKTTDKETPEFLLDLFKKLNSESVSFGFYTMRISKQSELIIEYDGNLIASFKKQNNQWFENSSGGESMIDVMMSADYKLIELDIVKDIKESFQIDEEEYKSLIEGNKELKSLVKKIIDDYQYSEGGFYKHSHPEVLTLSIENKKRLGVEIEMYRKMAKLEVNVTVKKRDNNKSNKNRYEGLSL